jgi:2-C-methyl-D-erythritol 4-phosphate cytidylyltransferase
MERIGQRVKMVDVGYENIKLTTDSDIAVMEAIIQKRKREENAKKPQKNER